MLSKCSSMSKIGSSLLSQFILCDEVQQFRAIMRKLNLNDTRLPIIIVIKYIIRFCACMHLISIQLLLRDLCNRCSIHYCIKNDVFIYIHIFHCTQYSNNCTRLHRMGGNVHWNGNLFWNFNEFFYSHSQMNLQFSVYAPYTYHKSSHTAFVICTIWIEMNS